MNVLEITGGSKVGWVKESSPNAKLRVTKDHLQISAPVVGTISFTRDDIVSIEPYGFIPIFAKGIKIRHRVANYRSKVIFYTQTDPKIVVDQIRQLGFLK